MRSLSRLLAIVVLVGCDESTPPPTHIEDPAPLAETAPARIEPAEPPTAARFVARNTALPSALTCPGPEICVRDYDSAVWILKREWEHHYHLDYGDPNAPIRARGGQRSERFAHIAAAVASVLSEEGASGAVGHCSLAALMPELYALNNGALVVDVPQVEPAPPRPMPVLPIVANAHLRSEYAFIDLSGAESMAWFTRDEMQHMSNATFQEAHVRHVSGERTIDGNHRTLDLLVAFSPESENVYILERTREEPEGEYQSQREERSRTDEQALVDFLRSLHVSRVSYDLAAACAIPSVFGGSEWMALVR